MVCPICTHRPTIPGVVPLYCRPVNTTCCQNPIPYSTNYEENSSGGNTETSGGPGNLNPPQPPVSVECEQSTISGYGQHPYEDGYSYSSLSTGSFDCTTWVPRVRPTPPPCCPSISSYSSSSEEKR